MQSPSDWLQLTGQLLWADSLPHCTGLFVPAPHAGMSQTIGVDKISSPAKISLIYAKIQQSISLLRGVLSKSGKSKKRSPSLSDIGFSPIYLHPESVTNIHRPFRELSQVGYWWKGGEGGGAPRGPYQSKVRRGCKHTGFTCALVPTPTLYNFPFCSLISFSFGCMRDPSSILYSLDMSKTTGF
jgi:hypothetical protein